MYTLVSGAFCKCCFYYNITVPLLRPTNVNGWEINSTALWVTWDPLPNTRDAIKGVIQGFEVGFSSSNIICVKHT